MSRGKSEKSVPVGRPTARVAPRVFCKKDLTLFPGPVEIGAWGKGAPCAGEARRVSVRGLVPRGGRGTHETRRNEGDDGHGGPPEAGRARGAVAALPAVQGDAVPQGDGGPLPRL